MEQGGDFYLSKVRPHRLDNLGLCTEYGNFRHALDPFPKVDPFNPPEHWFPQGIQRARVYTDVVIDKADIQDANVHALTHYWSHPLVHVSILRTLLDIPQVITDAECEAALGKWRQNRLATTALNKANKRLGDLLAEAGLSWDKVTAMLVDYRKFALDAGIDPRKGESA